jgi:small-conductance mechanosensitive channel
MSLTAPPALFIPWYWEAVQWLQGLLDTRPKMYLATVALPVSFVVAVLVIYRGGKPLKRRFTDELVEIARTLTIMFVALFDAVLFVIIWREFGATTNELDAFGSLLVPRAETAVNLYIAFIALLGTYMLTRVTKRLIRYWSENERISPHQRELAHHLTQITLFLVAVGFIFVLFGLKATDLFLGAGVLGVVLGLAARKTLANVLSGLIILFGRPFEAGDWIKVGDREGIVTDITVFNTQVRTFNEEHLLIPNDRVTDQEVINYSKTERLRLQTDVGIDYDDDISKAATIAKRTMESCETVADSPSPDVILESFGDSEVLLRLRYWITRPTIQHKLSAQNEVIEGVKAAFEEAEVTIPFPQRELMGREATDGLQVAPSEEAVAPDDDRLERAVRAVRDADAAGATAVSEPVQAEYAGGDADEAAGDGTAQDEPAADDAAGAETADGERAEEPVEDAYGGDSGDTSARDGAAAGPDVEASVDVDDPDDVESAAYLIEDEDADVSSPHPRDQEAEMYPGTMDDSLKEPVEEDYGRRRGETADDGDDAGDGEAETRDDGSRGDEDTHEDDEDADDDDWTSAGTDGSAG